MRSFSRFWKTYAFVPEIKKLVFKFIVSEYDREWFYYTLIP